MATINPQTVSGGALTYTPASAGGDTVAFGSATRPIILIRNASAASITVTMTGVVPCNQGSLHNVPVTCAVGDTEIDPPAQVIDASGTATRGNVGLTYSATTSITVAAVSS
jgi:hypothetical protein